MSEEPQFPPIPDIGDILERKDSLVERITSVLKCHSCNATFSRSFKKGDYTFKKLKEETCKECQKKGTLIIEEIFSEWINPKKEKK